MARHGYHHGDLRAALLDAAREIISHEGIEGFTLRKAAGRAGVSVGAPAHHFGDMRGLLTALATHVFRQLGDRLMALEPTENPAWNVRTQAAAYIGFAAENPGLFRLIGRVDLIDCRDPGFVAASFEALENFGKALSAYHGLEPPSRENRVMRPPLASGMATAHGLAHMVIEGRPSLLFETGDPTRQFLDEALPSILETAWPDTAKRAF